MSDTARKGSTGTRRRPSRDAIRALNRERQRASRRRRKAGLTLVQLELPMDVLLYAWRVREHIPPDVPDSALPLELIKEDLADVLTFSWAPRWLKKI
jgi:hypothetical protein